MKYIPGTTFTVGQATKPKQGGSVLQQKTAITRNSRAPEFKTNNTYVLDKIIVNPTVTEKIYYHFRNQTTDEVIVKEYSRLEEADNLIDSFMG